MEIDENSINYLMDLGYIGAKLTGSPATTITFVRNTAVNYIYQTTDPNCTFNLIGGELSDFQIKISGDAYPHRVGTISASAVNTILDAGYHGLIMIDATNTGLVKGVNQFIRDTPITKTTYSTRDIVYDFVIW